MICGGACPGEVCTWLACDQLRRGGVGLVAAGGGCVWCEGSALTELTFGTGRGLRRRPVPPTDTRDTAAVGWPEIVDRLHRAPSGDQQPVLVDEIVGRQRLDNAEAAGDDHVPMPAVVTRDRSLPRRQHLQDGLSRRSAAIVPHGRATTVPRTDVSAPVFGLIGAPPLYYHRKHQKKVCYASISEHIVRCKR